VSVGIGFHHDHDLRRGDFLPDSLQIVAQL
jgi:hypothetical protein